MLLRPRWIVGHVLVLVVVIVFVSLGFWQLDRHRDERRAERAARERREHLEIAGPDVRDLSEQAIADRGTVRATGRYDPSSTVFVHDRVRGDDNAFGVVAALVLDDGQAVFVDRGFLAGDDPGALVDAALPPTEIVEVSGPVRPAQTVEGDERADPEGTPPIVDRVVPEVLARGLAHEVLPVWIALEVQRPSADPDGPAPAVAEAAPSAGYEVDHLSYALQWFAFAAIPLVGWPILLVRVRRGATRSAPADGPRDRAGAGTR